MNNDFHGVEQGKSGAVPSPIIATLFFLSGLCGLGYEVIWAGQLRLVLGSSTAGIAWSIALFMAGMALGYAAGGRIARRVRRPVLAYGVVEVLLALLAIGVVFALPALQGIGGGPLAWLGAAAAILPCTFLAGVTLPLLVRSITGPLGNSIGRLYAINTAGAVAGVMFAGLFLVGELGFQGAAFVIVGLQIVVGAVAIVAGRGEDVEAALIPTGAKGGSGGWVWVALALAVGTASLAEEVLWTRSLAAHLNSSTYAFSIILAVFLAGLALGAAFAARVIRKGGDPATWLIATQLGAGFLVLGSPELIEFAEEAVQGYVGISQLTGLERWLSTMGVAIGRAAASLLAPAILLGFALPLLGQVCAGRGGDRSAVAGLVLGWNTLGAVLGSLGAHFVLLPLLGVGGGLQAAAGLHALVVGVVVLRAGRRRWAVALAVALALGAVVRPTAQPFLGRLVEGHKVLMVDEGIQDTTAVVELTTPGAEGHRQIFSNGISYAGDRPIFQRYMRLLGHLPALVARDQGRAMVICIGTGITAAAIASHADFETIDLVDISPAVHRTLPFFEASNARVQDDPRVRIHIADGRLFMTRSLDEIYDVITLEPPPPRVAGIAVLYSKEFYEEAYRLLAPGGAIAQWLPVHGLTTGELEMLTRAFLEVFPDGMYYQIEEREGALVATRGPGATREEIRRRTGAPAVASQLQGIGIADPMSLPQVDGPRLGEAVGQGPLVTDDHPRVEHFASGFEWSDVDEVSSSQRFLQEIFARGQP